MEQKHLEDLRAFCSKYPVRYFKKDRPLFYQGEVPQTAFFIKSGIVKTYNITNNGEEKIVGYESADSFVPVGWVFNRAPVALYYYDAFIDCQVYSVPKSELIDFINANQRVAISLMDSYVAMYVGATMHLHALEQSRAKDKLLHIMQYLVLRFGTPVNGGRYRINLRLTHQDIANLIGITRETVTTEISKLTKTGVLKSENLNYVVDSDKILRILGESDFENITL